MQDYIREYLSLLGKKSWQKRKSPQEFQRMKDISKLGVEARKRKKI